MMSGMNHPYPNPNMHPGLHPAFMNSVPPGTQAGMPANFRKLSKINFLTNIWNKVEIFSNFWQGIDLTRRILYETWIPTIPKALKGSDLKPIMIKTPIPEI